MFPGINKYMLVSIIAELINFGFNLRGIYRYLVTLNVTVGLINFYRIRKKL